MGAGRTYSSGCCAECCCALAVLILKRTRCRHSLHLYDSSPGAVSLFPPPLLRFACTAHAVMPTSHLQEHTGSDKAWVWSAVDYADGEHKVELFCIRFGTPESE